MAAIAATESPCLWVRAFGLPMSFAINTTSNKGTNMRLDEIDGTRAAEQRVKRLKDNAKSAKNRAKQMKTQADTSAERLDMQKSRQKLAQMQRAAVTSNIKPYH